MDVSEVLIWSQDLRERLIIVVKLISEPVNRSIFDLINRGGLTAIQ